MRLELIGRTASVLKLELFYLPQSKSDAAYIACGQTFARQAQTSQKEFIKHGLPPDFIQNLNVAVADLQRAMVLQKTSKGARADSIADFEETLKETLMDLKRFDVLVRNTFGNQPGIMAAWRIARHVGRPRSAKAATVKPG